MGGNKRPQQAAKQFILWHFNWWLSLALSLSESCSSEWEKQEYEIQVDKQTRYKCLPITSWEETWEEKGHKKWKGFNSVVFNFVWYLVSLNIWVGIVTCHGRYFGFHAFFFLFPFLIFKSRIDPCYTMLLQSNFLESNF